MIVGSIGLILVAAVLLVLGLSRGSDPFYYGSIMSSAMAALALIVGVRQFPAGRLPDADFDHRPLGRRPDSPDRPAGPPRPVGRARVPGQPGAPGVEYAADLADPALDGEGEVPADEPLGQVVSDGDAAALARLSTEVVVIDGRPRYHLPECLHLLGRECERVPLFEAIELGFTPCAQCAPVAVLIAGSGTGEPAHPEASPS